jgi:hypothetical protein
VHCSPQLRLDLVPLASVSEGDVGRRVVHQREGGHPEVEAQPRQQPGPHTPDQVTTSGQGKRNILRVGACAHLLLRLQNHRLGHVTKRQSVT